MAPAPLVSIVLPIFNDEDTVSAAIESCLAQTISEIEVICVDDGSTDRTADLIQQFISRDGRVRLLRHERSLSAFQARRTGILAASAQHVLFLDGDDELAVTAAETAYARAQSTDADLVGFGVTVVENDGRTGGRYEQRLQPVHRLLEGDDVLRGLYPIGKAAQGQLWRYLFRTRLLRDAYALMPPDLSLARVNDLPVMFIVAALATRYVSTSDRLYRYHFGRGGSGHRIDSVERAEFYTSAIDSICAIRPAVDALARSRTDNSLLLESYESARLSIIGYVCFQLIERSDSTVLDAALAHLHTVASAHDIIHAAARFYPGTLSTLKFHAQWLGLGDRSVRSVLLATSTLRTGGVSAVIASQAHYLREAGYRVTIVARSSGSDLSAIPNGATFVELARGGRIERLEDWAEICRRHEVDVVIDHQVLYSRNWPEFALMARAEGAATIGWMHNFVARPIFDGDDRLILIERCSSTLAHLVVLSPLDVAYFKLRGVTHASYAPNPPSPLLIESTGPVAKTPPQDRIELVWWGRLEQSTKQVRDLIAVGAELGRLAVDFRLTIIGPDWEELTAAKLNTEARKRGVGDRIVAVGPLHGESLMAAIDAADAFVSTSLIEGYQLTLAEAQARGLPVFMYELPWLTLVQNNQGILSVPQGDARGLARQVADLIENPDRYERLSQASLDAAQRARAYDFAALYNGLITGAVPPEFSPEPSLADAQQLLRLIVFYAERSHGRDRKAIVGLSSTGARLWRSAAPVGRAALRRFPGLRPLAHRAKQWLGAR